MTEPRIPPTAEFSEGSGGGKFDLMQALKLFRGGEVIKQDLEEEFRQTFFSANAMNRDDPEERLNQQWTLAYNCLLGMRNYGVAELSDGEVKHYRLTDVGQRLSHTTEPNELYDMFAEHVLRECHGLAVLEAIRTLQRKKDNPSKLNLNKWLRENGFPKTSRTSTHPIKLLGWIRNRDGWIGVLPESGYVINEEKLQELVGTAGGLQSEWNLLDTSHKAFLTILKARVTDESDLVPTKAITKLTRDAHGEDIFRREDSIRADVTRPLEETGWIIVQQKSAGRGGDSGSIGATQKLLNADLDLLEGVQYSTNDSKVQQLLDMPLADVFEGIESDEGTYVKGVALEALAAHMAHDLGLKNIRFRLMSARTGGTEVDLIAEGQGLLHSRWLFQCKNTPNDSVAVSVLAKEFGTAQILRAHVIVLVTTGSFSPSVEKYAQRIEERHLQQVILIDGSVVEQYRKGGSSVIQRFFHESAQRTGDARREDSFDG